MSDSKMSSPREMPPERGLKERKRAGSVDETWHKLHDYFNLAMLPIIVLLNLRYELSDNDEYFHVYNWTFLAYILLDAIWVLAVPCVASPTTILMHHVVTSFGLIRIATADSEGARFASLGALLEINTFFLIARRQFRGIKLMKTLFYVSWFFSRGIIGPYILYRCVDKVSRVYVETGSVMNVYASTGLVTLFLNILNVKWTYDLVYKLVFPSGKASKGL